MPVSRNGDLALVKGVGGAMDLVHARQESPRLIE
jgi:acyl CoA:acetate/3-ketoacid CoA transferase beta subunit